MFLMLLLSTGSLCKQNELSLRAAAHLYIPGTIFFCVAVSELKHKVDLKK